jgi:hypothetical protein
MQTSLLLFFVIKIVTQGREGVLRTTTIKHMHTIYEEAWQVDAWASTIDCAQSIGARASIDSPVACFMHDGRFW